MNTWEFFLFSGCWQALCRYNSHDPGHHTKGQYPEIKQAGLNGRHVSQMVISVPVHGSDTDDGIESSARKTYVFKTYLKDDHIKIQSKDDAVTLSDEAADQAQIDLWIPRRRAWMWPTIKAL